MEEVYRLVFLADFPDYAPATAALVLAERKHFYPMETQADAMQRVSPCINNHGPAFMLLALSGQELAGIVCVLKHSAPPGYEQLTPWLASLVAVPKHRGQGLESLLLNRAVLEAKARGSVELYTWTDSDKDWYQQQGWQVTGTTIFGRRYVGVLRKDLTK